MKSYTQKREREFSLEELGQHYRVTESQLQSHVDKMSLDELKDLAMSNLRICPVCEKITHKENINFGMYGECLYCPEDE